MKILMVSMPTLHFFRWANQLQNEGHEVYWFDVIGMDSHVSKIDWISQKVGWKLRWNYPGRTLIKSHFPKLYSFFHKFNQNSTEKVFESYLNEVQPDVVHSFALYVSCAPIVHVMEENPKLKWIYSSWGSDLYYFQNMPNYLRDIKRVLPRVDYLLTDCNRDYDIAKQYGFKGSFMGVFPGGGGFYLDKIQGHVLPNAERDIILIKGFQGRSGRAIPVLKAIERLQNELSDYHIEVFGADPDTFGYIEESQLASWDNFVINGKVSHEAVLQKMGKALLYIGNSNSDGTPNTMLEAICLGAFPIQSNPGGATAETIEHGVNGLLITDCENSEEIKKHILDALNLVSSYTLDESISANYGYETVKDRVLKAYREI